MDTSNVCVVACVQLDNVTTDSQLPFHLELNWVSNGSDMHVVNNSKCSVACETTNCELKIINSLDLSLVYLQLQLAQLILTHLIELNYFTTCTTTLPTLLQL